MRNGARDSLVRATFNAAADHFDDPAPRVQWEHCGRRTVDLAGVRGGAHVLDMCCGTGASALPAAEHAGPQGWVRAVDVAERPLLKGRAKAARRGLQNLEFRLGDLADPPADDGSMDAVVCVFGLYFAMEPARTVSRLWTKVAAGGVLAVTTWGDRVLEPAHALVLDVIAEQCDGRDFRGCPLSWERFDNPDALSQVFAAAGVPQPVITCETLHQPVRPSDVWSIVLGSGYRVLLAGLSPADMNGVGTALRRRLRTEGVHELVSDVIYAVSRRADPGPDGRT